MPTTRLFGRGGTRREFLELGGAVAALSVLGSPLHALVARAREAAPAATVGSARDGRSAAAQQPVALVTGSTGGLGREVARRLGAMGYGVIVHGRDGARGTSLVEEIRRQGPGRARFYVADLGSFAQVGALAEAVRRDYQRLDVLVNNAGIWLAGPRQTSAEGHELHFQVNYLSGFLLTRLLLPLVLVSAPARIVNVASGAQTGIDFDDVMLERAYSDSRAYAQSKLAQVMFTFDLARELEGSGILVNALHPATLMNTDMVLSRGIRPQSSVDEGAEAVLHLVTSPAVGSGRYFSGTRPSRAHRQAYDEAARSRLRELSAALTGA